MNERQRVIAAIEHREPDKVPWEIVLTPPARRKLADYTGDLQLLDDAYFARWIGSHVRWVAPQSRGLFHALEEESDVGLGRDGWGVVWDTRGLYGEGEWGRPVSVVLPQPDLSSLTLPEPLQQEAFAHYPRFIDEHREWFIVGGEAHLFEVAWALRGMENLLEDMVLRPRFVDELMHAITEHYLVLIERSTRHDIDAFSFGDDWGCQRGLIMGPRLWRRFIKPHLARMFERVKARSKFVHLHSDGKIDAIFTDLIELGLDVYNPLQPEVMDPYAMKRCFGDRLCFHGGVGEQELLRLGTRREVKEATKRLMAEVGAGGGYVLAQAHPDGILGDVPVENIVALIEAVHEQ